MFKEWYYHSVFLFLLNFSQKWYQNFNLTLGLRELNVPSALYKHSICVGQGNANCAIQLFFLVQRSGFAFASPSSSTYIFPSRFCNPACCKSHQITRTGHPWSFCKIQKSKTFTTTVFARLTHSRGFTWLPRGAHQDMNLSLQLQTNKINKQTFATTNSKLLAWTFVYYCIVINSK